MSDGKEILRGWKEIEAFLRLTRKTIIAGSYPVHFHRGAANGRRVYAFKSELWDFAKTQDKPP